MIVDIIIPTNNKEEINGFIKSYSKNVNKFQYLSRLNIIINGNLKPEDINSCKLTINIIQAKEDYTNEPVSFTKLRSMAMINRDSDFFLFFDDDHRFNDYSDDYLFECCEFLMKNTQCSILCTDRYREYLRGVHLKRDGFIWTNRGLFIKNLQLNYQEQSSLVGAGEDLLFSYMTLQREGFAYTNYGSDITRKEKRHLGKEIVPNISYNKDITDKNIIGFIRFLFEDEDWEHESDIFYSCYPNGLKKILEKRAKNEDRVNRP